MHSSPVTAPAVLYCHCHYARVIPPEVKDAVLKHLCASDRPFESVPDLCELAARRDPALQQLSRAGPLKIAACYPRAVKWLFAAAGAPLSPDSTEVLNLRTLSADQVIESLRRPEINPNLPPGKSFGGQPRPPMPDQTSPAHWVELDAGAVAEPAEAARAALGAPAPGRWQPWFPVIDYDRCTNCMQCLSFCLFGVYGVDENRRIQVQNSDHCKTNCPACSRVCPEAAIMFPKYKTGPINGDQVSDADLAREKMKVDISALLGGDVHSLLRDRSERARSRFSTERSADKALTERQKCLANLNSLARELPPEVLMSLPSPEEIARKAEEAAARARAARGEEPA